MTIESCSPRRCRCEACAPDFPSYTDTRAWAFECEARWVAAMPLERRREYLDVVQRKRGDSSRADLEKALTARWEAARPVAATLEIS